MEKTPKLTDRQRKFVDLYIELGNATEAAKGAGYCGAYAQGVKRQPSVQALLAERRKQMPVAPQEVLNFLTGIMRGNIKADQLRGKAAAQLGIRAGLWKSEYEMKKIVKELLKEETNNE